MVSAGALQLPLWGGLGEEDRMRARRALVRVQGLLGPEAVQVPVLSGGRGPAERITLTPLGDEPVPRADPRSAMARSAARAVADGAARRSGGIA